MELCELYVQYCENITFENCIIYFCSIDFCRNIKVNNSTFVNLDVELTKNSNFQNNKLHKYSGFTERTIKHNGEGEKLVEYQCNLYCSLIIFFMLAPIFILMSILFFMAYGGIPINFIILFMIFLAVPTIILLIGLYYKRKMSSIKKFPPNIFNNNSLIELNELYEKYSQNYDI
ncbi:MAG: hypothetical protein ACFFDN_51790 [Candidatus Hodarchaeota archaeon]